MNVLGKFVNPNKHGKNKGEYIINLDVSRIDMEELRDTIQNEIEKRL